VTDYCSTPDVAFWLNIEDGTDNERIAMCIAAAQPAVIAYCGRTFDTDTVATARYFRPLDYVTVAIDDCWEVTSVATDNGEDGTWSTVWAAGDWLATPVGGVSPFGGTGWPATGILSVEAREFAPTVRPYVKVTGKWGWASLPGQVRLATIMYSAALFQSHNMPLETVPGVPELLAPFQRASGGGSKMLVA
jgi:hypothetical protein